MQEKPTKEQLIACFEDTKRLCEEDAELVAVTQEAKRKTVLFYEKPTAERFTGKGGAAQISVIENTTFRAALPLADGSKTVAVLNFASPLAPGGGVQSGAMAQEESLCRSSNLFACLHQPLFWENYYNFHRAHNNGLYSDRLIYSKGVTVFKSDDEIPQLLPREQWRRVDVITCAMPNLRGEAQYATDFLLSLYKRRIRAILQAAISIGAKYLVLGAIGCGAFGNDPDLMAEAFRSVLVDGNYATAFEQIVFAVKSSADKRNLTAFQQAFSDVMQKRTDNNSVVPPLTKKVYEPIPSKSETCVVISDFGANAAADLEAAMRNARARDTKSILRAVWEMASAPLYLPVETDTGKMFGKNDLTDVQSGTELTLQNDIPMRMLYIEIEGEMAVPLFTSVKRLSSDFSATLVQLPPQKWIPLLLAEKKGVAVNPFTEEAHLFFNADLFKNTLVDMALKKGTYTPKNLAFGRYLIQRRLKKVEGNISYQALDIQTNTPCFLEAVDHQAKHGEVLAQILISEARYRQRLSAYAVPEVLDIGETDSIIYVVSEWIEGETLLTLLRKNGRLSQDRVVNIAIQLCDVLYAMETMAPPIVHRSIAPANLLLKPSGQVFLLDFSTAREYVYGLAADEVLVGVRGYAAPEQFGGMRQSDPRADIYGLGMTMYALLTGLEPQNVPQGYLPLRQYNLGFSKKLELILLKCIQPDPQFRYQNAEELKADLRKV